MKLNDKDNDNTLVPGYIQISVEELPSIKDEVTVKIQGNDLDKKNWFGKSDPFLEISKVTENTGFVLAFRTEVRLFI